MSAANDRFFNMSGAPSGEGPNLRPIVLVSLLIISAVLNVALALRLHSVTKSDAAPFSSVNMLMDSVPASSLTGEAVKIDLRHGSPETILYIYAPGCGWCAKNLKNIKQLAHDLHQRGTAEVVGLSLDTAGLHDYLEKADLDFPTYAKMPADFLKTYRLGITPQTLVVKNGVIIRDWRGAYTASVQREVEGFFQVRLPGLTQ